VIIGPTIAELAGSWRPPRWPSYDRAAGSCAQARELPAVRAIYDVMHASARLVLRPEIAA
jgi:hypothetical protein